MLKYSAEKPPTFHQNLYYGLTPFLELHWFEIHRVPVAAFPRVKMWTDYRNRAYAEAMIGGELPPILICGDHWLDGNSSCLGSPADKKCGGGLH